MAEQRPAMRFGSAKDGLIDLAVRVLREHRAEGAVGADGAAAVADREVAALRHVLVFDEVFGPFDELLARGAGAQHLRQAGVAEDIAEEGFRVAGHPAVALRDRAFGIHGDELVGTILLPDAGQPGGSAGEMMNERVERPEGDPAGLAALHPDVEEPGQKLRQRPFSKSKSASTALAGPPGKP